jgi:hypothetical protein
MDGCLVGQTTTQMSSRPAQQGLDCGRGDAQSAGDFVVAELPKLLQDDHPALSLRQRMQGGPNVVTLLPSNDVLLRRFTFSRAATIPVLPECRFEVSFPRQTPFSAPLAAEGIQSDAADDVI